MENYRRNSFIQADALPVEIVFHPSWWYKNAGIIFDEDFYYHPFKRIEAEKQMENELYERFGRYGLGSDHGKNLPVIGAVHNAAGYILSGMLGCKVTSYVCRINTKREKFFDIHQAKEIVLYKTIVQ